jgi:hypothetical protein
MTVGVVLEDCPLSAALWAQIIRIKKLVSIVLIERSRFLFNCPVKFLAYQAPRVQVM